MYNYLSNNYLVALSIALVQLAILASLLYQIRQSLKGLGETERTNTEPSSEGTSRVTQLEFDTKSSTKSQVNTMNINDLNDDEIKVLKYLVDKGIETYQAEIARELGLPKSTVSRIIRRLYEKNLIIIKRSGRITYIQVVDPDYVSDVLSKFNARP